MVVATAHHIKRVDARETQTGDGLKELDISQTVLIPLLKVNPTQEDPPLNPKTMIITTTTRSNKATEFPDEKLISVKETKKDSGKITTASSKLNNIQKGSFTEIYNVPKGYCALTFDDGPSKYTEKIAQLLKTNHIPATFFFIGENVKRSTNSVKFANNLGFGIGDHSYTHPQFTKLSETSQVSQILTTKNLIESITKKPVTLFRPPYGSFNNQTKDVLVKNHMQMVLWNCDPRDWATKSPSVIVQRIKNSQLSGKVIILHDQKQTWEALPQIIKVIKAKGLKVKAI